MQYSGDYSIPIGAVNQNIFMYIHGDAAYSIIWYIVYIFISIVFLGPRSKLNFWESWFGLIPKIIWLMHIFPTFLNKWRFSRIKILNNVGWEWWTDWPLFLGGFHHKNCIWTHCYLKCLTKTWGGNSPTWHQILSSGGFHMFFIFPPQKKISAGDSEGLRAGRQEGGRPGPDAQRRWVMKYVVNLWMI